MRDGCLLLRIQTLQEIHEKVGDKAILARKNAVRPEATPKFRGLLYHIGIAGTYRVKRVTTVDSMLRRKLEELYRRRELVEHLIQTLETERGVPTKPSKISPVPRPRNRENSCNAIG